LPQPEGRYLALAATDPANPYGAGVAWPKREGSGQGGRRPSRTPGAFVLLRDGEPLLFVERGGRGILRLSELEHEVFAEAVGELADAAHEGVLPRLAIERLDGEPVIGSGHEEMLIAAGFSRQPRRLVASA
jgi:ATP-dependent Lhr-like helicase